MRVCYCSGMCYPLIGGLWSIMIETLYIDDADRMRERSYWCAGIFVFAGFMQVHTAATLLTQTSAGSPLSLTLRVGSATTSLRQGAAFVAHSMWMLKVHG